VVVLSSEQFASAATPLDASAIPHGFAEALRHRTHGRALAACALWARLEAAAEEAGDRHLAIQAGAQRSMTLTGMGALSAAGVLCERLLSELEELEDRGQPLPPPPIERTLLHAGAGVWFSVAGLYRLRAEQLRRSGDYVGALEELEEAARCADQRPEAALPVWGRVILSDTIRLAGDFEGALEVASAARRCAAKELGGHPRVAGLADRAEARALLALGDLDSALTLFERLARRAPQRTAEAREAGDLGIGELLRRRGLHRRAGVHLERARDLALREGHVIAWIHAQLCLAELARASGAAAAETLALVDDVLRRLPLAEHPWLRMRTFLLAALSADEAQAEGLIDRAEQELPRFHRRSCDLELERVLLERCRIAVETGVAADPIDMDFL
jgi:tetratricopeptide (TPR) repeat protein